MVLERIGGWIGTKEVMTGGTGARSHSRKCRSLMSLQIRHVQTKVHQAAGVMRTLHELAGPQKIAEWSAHVAECKQGHLRGKFIL